jgi:16S rRNA (cytidine1402-2'-O)-methyltransferase
LPGATAFVPALINSGFSAQRFCFEGFLPLKKGRQTLLKLLATETRTIIFYESPVRLVKTLTDLSTYMGETRRASVSREITKMFEETRRGTLQELIAYFTQKPPKGEIVLVLEGRDEKSSKSTEN